jgi:cell division protein FtsW
VRRAFFIGRMAMSQERLFAGLVAQGIGVWIGLQTFIHAGVNTGLLPTKGLTLPFISHGGSSMLVVCLAMGILLRIDLENRRHVRGRVAEAGRPAAREAIA